MVRVEPAKDPEALRHESSALGTAADKASRTYDRETWVRFTLVFFPVPFVLVLLRLQIEAWGNHVAGALFLASAAGLYALDGMEEGDVR
jgi:hypothetical protein